jgi:hypothetical protein
MRSRLILFVPGVITWFAFANCLGANECNYSDVACEGNVQVTCGSEERNPRLTVHRTPCPDGTLCSLGYFSPTGLPSLARPQCFTDLGPDPRCMNQTGFCSDEQPFGCQDGHLLGPVAERCPLGATCNFDPTRPGGWPTCVGSGDGGPRPPAKCEDLGDASTFCSNLFPSCDDSGINLLCYNGWHISDTCCDPYIDPGGEVCTGMPFRRLDGSIQKRPEGFLGCKYAGSTPPSWCCIEGFMALRDR